LAISLASRTVLGFSVSFDEPTAVSVAMALVHPILSILSARRASIPARTSKIASSFNSILNPVNTVGQNIEISVRLGRNGECLTPAAGINPDNYFLLLSSAWLEL
jgi:hypothetical protein